MQEYYNRRAREYERIYYRDDPVRQSELAAMSEAIEQAFTGRRALEVACGTGFWTEVAARVARSVVATDASPEMLAIARAKGLPGNVEFRQADAYALASVPGDLDAGLANFWLSHVPKARIEEFLDGFHARIGIGSVVFMADNIYLPGVGGELVVEPGSEDTFKLRELQDGTKHKVLKNYYDAGQPRDIFGPRSDDLNVHVGECFWWVSYRVR